MAECTLMPSEILTPPVTPAVLAHSSTTSPLSARRTASSVSSPPISASSPTAPVATDNPGLRVNNWDKGVEKARKSLSEAEISTLDFLLAGGNSIDTAVNELKTEMASRGLGETQSDTTRRLHKFLQTADKYGKVVDVVIQHSPEVTSLVWGSMRMVIDV